jgi:hypothetical protein
LSKDSRTLPISLGPTAKAAVVDPKRDIDDYLAVAERQGLRIVAISNSQSARRFRLRFPRTGRPDEAKFMSRTWPGELRTCRGQGCDSDQGGSSRSDCSKTPGTLARQSLSFLVRENASRGSFTGDLLFVNDVDGPICATTDEDPSALAAAFYDSLHEKILTLPDEVKVYPAHGAGSLCGRAISDAPFSLGRPGTETELGDADRGATICPQMTANLPDRPA